MNINREIYSNVAGILCKNIFSISENRATRKPKNSNIKHYVTVMSYLDRNFYYIYNLLIIMTLNERY